MKVIAHRGFSGVYPENTMLAFDKALEAGCTAIELDVHFSKDGSLVIIHDETLDRTTDATGFVRDYTLAELQKMNAGTINTFQTIPTLDEYFIWARNHGIFTNIEIKTDRYYYQGIEQATLDLINKHDLKDQCLISSFNHGSVIRMKQLDSSILCAFLVDAKGLGAAGAYCASFGVEYYHPNGVSLTQQAVEECHKHGVKVNVWTVDSLDRMHDMNSWNVDGVITNYCDAVLKLV